MPQRPRALGTQKKQASAEIEPRRPGSGPRRALAVDPGRKKIPGRIRAPGRTKRGAAGASEISGRPRPGFGLPPDFSKATEEGSGGTPTPWKPSTRKA